VFLLVSLRFSERRPDVEHPFGYGKERFFWSFMAAVMIFVSGAVFSAFQGVERIASGGSGDESFGIAYAILGFSLLAEGVSLARALKQTRGEAREAGRPLLQFVRRSRDPTTKTVLFEDTVAVAGVVVALAGVAASVPLAVAGFALVGLGAAPLGGVLADRCGGARVTMASFVVMAVGALGAVRGLGTHSFGLFLGSFLLLFVASGAGNGSVYRMIPAVFRAGVDTGRADALARCRKTAAGCIGIAGAVGALGGFAIPRGFALSTSVSGSLRPALLVFVGVYVALLALTWAVYHRKGATMAAEGV
jgi:hypothetical protein